MTYTDKNICGGRLLYWCHKYRNWTKFNDTIGEKFNDTIGQNYKIQKLEIKKRPNLTILTTF